MNKYVEAIDTLIEFYKDKIEMLEKMKSEVARDRQEDVELVKFDTFYCPGRVAPNPDAPDIVSSHYDPTTNRTEIVRMRCGL